MDRSATAGDPLFYFPTIQLRNMLSLFTSTRPRKTTLVFPDDQQLWKFFAGTELSVFRIESSNHTIAGKFDRNKIDLAREKFGASELPQPACRTATPVLFRQLSIVARAACALW